MSKRILKRESNFGHESVGLDFRDVCRLVGAEHELGRRHYRGDVDLSADGPIMGIGLSVGINDFELMKRSLRNFGLMVLVSILTSTLYFLLSPLSEAKSELWRNRYADDL